MKIYEQDEKKVVIRLDELAVAMRADEDVDRAIRKAFERFALLRGRAEA